MTITKYIKPPKKIYHKGALSVSSVLPALIFVGEGEAVNKVCKYYYLRIVRMPMAATQSPTVMAMTMMMTAARPVQHKSQIAFSILRTGR